MISQITILKILPTAFSRFTKYLKTSCFVTSDELFAENCSSDSFCFLCSFGELAGLHRRAGTPRTTGSTPPAQTLYKAADNGPGQSAADRTVLLHVRLESTGLSLHAKLECLMGAALNL